MRDYANTTRCSRPVTTGAGLMRMAPLNRPTVTSNAGCNKHCCRESLDFDSVSLSNLHRLSGRAVKYPCLDKLQQERPHLQQLPTHRYLDYETSVSKSLVTAPSRFCILYTVPSRLIGQRLSLPRPFARFVGTNRWWSCLGCVCLAHLTAAVPVHFRHALTPRAGSMRLATRTLA